MSTQTHRGPRSQRRPATKKPAEEGKNVDRELTEDTLKEISGGTGTYSGGGGSGAGKTGLIIVV